jgi:hypothetical protein
MLGKLNRDCMKSSSMLLMGCGLDDQTSIPGYIQNHSRAAPSVGEAPSEGLNEVRSLGHRKN